MAIKIEFKDDKITPFGGLYSVIRAFRTVEYLIDWYLGKRVKTIGYNYGEIMRAMMCIYLAGGDRIEDIKTYEDGIEYQPGMKICSPDTILRALEELKEENTVYTSNRGISYNFNLAERLNNLAVNIAVDMGWLDPSQEYILDYDNKFIEAEKYDTKYGYTKERGYFPGVTILTNRKTNENFIVGVEGRDGNANVKFKQEETLERSYIRVESRGIYVYATRCDCGSYAFDIIDVIQRHSKLFYVRANSCEDLREEFEKHKNWEKVELNDFTTVEVLSLPFIGFNGRLPHCRLVVQRTEMEDPDLFGKYVYRSILTNDWEHSEAEIINFYNQRGSEEKLFDQMDNDFGWNYLPKSFLNSNTAFMVLTAIIRNFYCSLLSGERVKQFNLNSKSRTKAFISKFIAVPAKWTRRARLDVLNMYTENQAYAEIFNLGFG